MGGFGLSRRCPLGRFGAITVLSAWSFLGCHSVVRLVRLGGFGLSRCCPPGPLGWFWAVTVLSAWAVLGCHSVVRLGSFGLSRCCPLGLFWAVTVLSAWSAWARFWAVTVLSLDRFWTVTVLSAWAVFGLSRCCPLGRFWAVTVLSAWSAWVVLVCHGVVACSVLGCQSVVRLVRVGSFVTVLSAWSLLGCQPGPLGWFWAVTVLSAWSVLGCLSILGCHGVVRLVGFGLSRCFPLSAWVVLGYTVTD